MTIGVLNILCSYLGQVVQGETEDVMLQEEASVEWLEDEGLCVSVWLILVRLKEKAYLNLLIYITGYILSYLKSNRMEVLKKFNLMKVTEKYRQLKFPKIFNFSNFVSISSNRNFKLPNALEYEN
jgi:hypothetical protein